MNECENLANCGFVKKFEAKHLVTINGFILKYCRGEHQGECKRKDYKKQHGACPDDLLPNGVLYKE